MTLILGIHVDANGCALAITDGGVTLATASAVAQRGANEKLIPLLDQILTEAQKTLDEVDWIAANVGPGSFTGIRVGLAAAHGLAIARDKKIFGAAHLACLAAALPLAQRTGKDIFVAEPSGKGDFYVAAYDQHLKPILSPTRAQDFYTYMPPKHDNWILLGAAAIDARAALGFGDVIEKSQLGNLAEAACRFAHANIDDASQYPHDPLYFRDADVTLRSNAG